MVAIVHLADLHLDSPFQGLSRDQPELATRLQDATLTALDRAVKVALALREAGRLDAVTLGGDQFDQNQPSLRARRRFREALVTLSDAGLPVLIVAGNHDPLETTDFWQRGDFPPGVTLFGVDWSTVELRRNGQVIAAVAGRSYTRSMADGRALDGLPAPTAPVNLGLVHIDVGGTSGEQSYAPVPLAELQNSRYDAWLLGHIHKPDVLSEQPLVIYPGNPQGRDMGEDGPRGGALVELAPGQPATVSMLPLATITWRKSTVDITGCADDVAVADRVRDRLDSGGEAWSPPASLPLGAEHIPPPEGVIARVELRGEAASVELWNELASAEKLDVLAAEIDDPDRAPFRILDQLTAQVTRPVPDHDTLRQWADDLLGDLARLVDDAADEDTEAGRALTEAWAALLEHAVLKQHGGWPALGFDRAALLEEAERLVAVTVLGQEASDED